ncbi:hypothetical protein [Streptococcus sobrinus]|uniref:hypothetical protein n=1 Tax=Streptococcus sobrinus TaxID=1310 RepID=UPI000381D049|nr:hypothetical protein [Streptococcus sobrinus]
MAESQTMELKIRGLKKSEVDYLKALSKKEKASSFNQFLLRMCREKIRYGQFNRTEHLYLAHLTQMAETTTFLRQQWEKKQEQLRQMDERLEKINTHISKWLEYEGMIESEKVEQRQNQANDLLLASDFDGLQNLLLGEEP